MAVYNITLKDRTVRCKEDQYIMDAIEDERIQIPYSCRVGSCSACLCVINSGTVDQSDQSYLTPAQISQGLCLPCVAYAQSDVNLTIASEGTKELITMNRPDPEVDSTIAAIWYYFFGNGEDRALGPETKFMLRNSERIALAVERLRAGVTDLSGNFSVDLTEEIYHAGRTTVVYDTVCSGGYCTTTFTGFVQVNNGVVSPDGFRDPLSTGEKYNYMVEIPGGTPYNYVPYSFNETYPQPGS
ncbi:2Fe-2S type ferredoxin [Agrobacterium vitis]|nr:2Fe-2S type ferredoxin [Agrobacterium vitis]MBE1439200.1 2Fe-2S type ferredoxin [Agrobacterium vitis]